MTYSNIYIIEKDPINNIPAFKAAWAFSLVSAFDSVVSIFEVLVKSALLGAFDFVGDSHFGDSFKIRPPGPFGTAWNDLPRNRIDVGIPVDHPLVISSNAVSVPVLFL